jgi:hypothetical protein
MCSIAYLAKEQLKKKERMRDWCVLSCAGDKHALLTAGHHKDQCRDLQVCSMRKLHLVIFAEMQRSFGANSASTLKLHAPVRSLLDCCSSTARPLSR